MGQDVSYYNGYGKTTQEALNSLILRLRFHFGEFSYKIKSKPVKKKRHEKQRMLVYTLIAWQGSRKIKYTVRWRDENGSIRAGIRMRQT
jgi:hypothetical protein